MVTEKHPVILLSFNESKKAYSGKRAHGILTLQHWLTCVGTAWGNSCSRDEPSGHWNTKSMGITRLLGSGRLTLWKTTDSYLDPFLWHQLWWKYSTDYPISKAIRGISYSTWGNIPKQSMGGAGDFLLHTLIYVPEIEDNVLVGLIKILNIKKILIISIAFGTKKPVYWDVSKANLCYLYFPS